MSNNALLIAMAMHNTRMALELQAKNATIAAIDFTLLFNIDIALHFLTQDCYAKCCISPMASTLHATTESQI